MSQASGSHTHPLHRLKQLYVLERRDIWVILAYSVGAGLMSLSTPVAVQALVSSVAFGALYQPLVVLTLILLASISFSNLLTGIQFYVLEMLQRRVFVRFFGETAHRIHRASIITHEQENVPEMVNRFFDVMTLQKTGAVLLLEGAGYALQTFMGMLLLAFYHPMLLAFDLLLVALLAFILFGLGRGGVRTAIVQSKAKYAAVAWLEDIAHNPTLFKSRGGPDFVAQRSDELASAYLAASAEHFRIIMRQNVGALGLHAIASTLLLGMGGWMVMDRQLTLGQLIAAELVVSTMIYAFTRLGKILDNYYEMMAGVDKLGHLLDLPGETGGSEQPEATPQALALSLRKVALCDEEGQFLLQGLDLEVPAGDGLALSGAGRECRLALMEMLFGLRMPASGSVLMDGKDLRSLELDALRRQVALVDKAEVFAGTVLENLRLGQAQIGSELAFEALRSVGLLDAVLALPQGLDTPLNHHGAPLQPEALLRLTLARALLGRPRLLLIHEALDGVDPRSNSVILDALFHADAPWTLLLSSRDPEVLSRCKRIVHLPDVSGRME